jgi:hypothetical protein
VIVWINARLHLACDNCHHRWLAPEGVDTAGVHYCDDCKGKPRARVPGQRRRFLGIGRR